MAAPNISIQLFSLRSASGRNIETLLDQISRTPKLHRWRQIGATELALLETRRDRGRNLYLLDFVKRRYVGPGKVRADSELDSFQFGQAETFGEETSVLVDLDRHWMVIQYNQHGVRAPSIAEYLNIYNHDPDSDWLIEAMLDPETDARVRRKHFVRAAQITVKLSNEVNEVLREQGEGLGRALGRAGRESQAAVMSVELKMSHDEGFLASSVRNIARRLALLDERAVRAVKLTGRETENGHDETIDLLRHRIKTKYSSEDLEVEGGRYTLDSRWRALMRIHAGWVQNF